MVKGRCERLYKLKTVTVQGKMNNKDVLVVEFTDEAYQIIGAFLMTDAPLMNFSVLTLLEKVLVGKKAREQFSGNRCRLDITKEKTIINDLFSGLGDDVPAYRSCEVETRQLKDWVVQWKKDKESFARKKVDY